jgi:hypothetical protein
MNSLNFLNSLENDKPKIKYQSYSIDIGLEQVDILIPFDYVNLFEEKINKIKPTTVEKIKSLLKEFNGHIEHIRPFIKEKNNATLDK